MKCQHSLYVATVFLAMSGSLSGSESGKVLQVRESDLAPLIQGKRVTLHLVEGSRVEGRVRKVTANALVFKVKKSSNPAAYPKGQTEIPRAAVSRIEARGLKHSKMGRNTATVATFFGALLGSFFAVSEAGSDSGGTVGQGVAIVAIPIGAAVLVYRALASKDVTRIEILSDSPGERVPKPANKDTSLNITIPAGTAPLFFETSSPGPLRQQVLRALMRQDSPRQLSDQEPAAR